MFEQEPMNVHFPSILIGAQAYEQSILTGLLPVLNQLGWTKISHQIGVSFIFLFFKNLK